MTDRTFIDTNILVYAYDTHEPLKHERAQAILKRGIEAEIAVLSAQVLSEFLHRGHQTHSRPALDPGSRGCLGSDQRLAGDRN